MNSTYTPELADEICSRIADGKSLRTICKAEDMPSRDTVRRWLNGDAVSEKECIEFKAKYARAREDQADVYAEECVEIADEETDAAKARNRIAARQWYASKLRPKVYGDKMLHTGDDDNPVLVRIERVIVEEPNPLKTLDNDTGDNVGNGQMPAPVEPDSAKPLITRKH